MPFFASFFGNPALLLGTLGASIPVIIHLLNRQRFKTLHWAAMHWLWASFKKSHRRIKIEQILLLIIRTLILLCLALAMARPALKQAFGLSAGRAGSHRVIVLDNSFSMGQTQGGKSLFERAKDIAAELAPNTEAGRVDLLLSNSLEDTVLWGGSAGKRRDFLTAVKTAQLSDGGTALPKAVAAACRVLNETQSKETRREIIVITDRTRAAWERSNNLPQTLNSADEQAVSKSFGDPERKPKVVVLRLNGESEPVNVAPISIEADEKTVLARTETQFTAAVASYGNSPATNVRVHIKVDGEETATETIPNIARGKPETFGFRHVFAEPGSHVVTLEVDADGLTADNALQYAVEAAESTRALLVDGQPRAAANESEMDYLHQALAPNKADEIQAGRMPLQPETISGLMLADAVVEPFALVALGNVANVPREKIRALEQYVRGGGALLIFPGDQVDATVYNRELETLLPMNLGEITGSGDPDGVRESLDTRNMDHPALARLKGVKGFALNQLQTWRHFRLTPKAGKAPETVTPKAPAAPVAPKTDDVPVSDTGSGLVRTVLSYENGDPAIVEMTLGRGRVMLFSSTADKAWNNYPTKTQFMPLMNSLALEMMRPPHAARNRKVGERFVLPLRRQDVGDIRRSGMRVTGPNGDTVPFEINAADATAESAPLTRAGVYTMPNPSAEKADKGEKGNLLLAAVRDPEESDLATIDSRDILAFVPKTADDKNPSYFGHTVTQEDFSLLDNGGAKEAEDILQINTAGAELWRWLALAVLILLIAESIMARRFGDYTR